MFVLHVREHLRGFRRCFPQSIFYTRLHVRPFVLNDGVKMYSVSIRETANRNRYSCEILMRVDVHILRRPSTSRVIRYASFVASSPTRVCHAKYRVRRLQTQSVYASRPHTRRVFLYTADRCTRVRLFVARMVTRRGGYVVVGGY